MVVEKKNLLISIDMQYQLSPDQLNRFVKRILKTDEGKKIGAIILDGDDDDGG